MDHPRREILNLAEEGAWEDVITCLKKDQELGTVQDDFGMTPLHWVCTEPSISLDSFSAIVNMCPEACQVKNLSGMLPIHVAVTNKMPCLHIGVLLEKYPEATFLKDHTGKYPVEIASQKNLPRFTTDLIKKASIHAMRSSSSLERASSSSMSIRSTSSSSSSSCLYISSPMDQNTSSRLGSTLDSNEISTQLKDLLLQLQQLSVDIRTRSSNSSGASTERSSSSSSSTNPISSMGRSLISQVLWNPRDKVIFEPHQSSKTGATIKKFSSKSSALGIENLSIGDVLVSINGINVQETSHASILRFLKHVKVTCKLGFMKPSLLQMNDNSESIINSTSMHSFENQEETLPIMEPPSSPALDPEVLFSKINQVLEITLQKVSQVEENVRLSSVISLCP